MATSYLTRAQTSPEKSSTSLHKLGAFMKHLQVQVTLKPIDRHLGAFYFVLRKNFQIILVLKLELLKQLNLFSWARRRRSENKHSLICSTGRAIIRQMLFLSNSSALRVGPSVHTGNMCTYLPEITLPVFYMRQAALPCARRSQMRTTEPCSLIL